jgi:hypothetical protein
MRPAAGGPDSFGGNRSPLRIPIRVDPPNSLRRESEGRTHKRGRSCSDTRRPSGELPGEILSGVRCPFNDGGTGEVRRLRRSAQTYPIGSTGDVPVPWLSTRARTPLLGSVALRPRLVRPVPLPDRG